MLSLFTPFYTHCFVIFFSLFALFQPKFFADQPIIVEKDGARYNSQSIIFSLKAKSISKINRVTLIHGVKSNTCLGGSQARREIEFTAGAQIEIAWTWNLSLSGNLPPGGTIWWQWELQDEDNQTLLTDPQTLTVEDPNFHWQELQTQSLTLFWSKGDSQFGSRLLQIGKDSLQRLSKDAGLESTGPVRIMVYPSSTAMQDALVNSSDWAGGVAFPEYNVVMIGIAPDQMDWAAEAIPHELAHLITGRLIYNCTGTDLPTWLSEGLADYAAGPISESVRASILTTLKAGDLPVLTSLSNGFAADSYLAAQSYDQSHMVVEFMIDRYGTGSIDALLNRIRDGKQIDATLQEVYGLDTAGLDRTWRASLGVGTAPMANSNTVTPSDRPTPIPTLPLFSPLSSPVVLITAALDTPTPAPAMAKPATQSPSATPILPPESPSSPAGQYLLLIGLGISAVTLAAVVLLRRNR
jgi:hypothetical protein